MVKTSRSPASRGQGARQDATGRMMTRNLMAWRGGADDFSERAGNDSRDDVQPSSDGGKVPAPGLWRTDHGHLGRISGKRGRQGGRESWQSGFHLSLLRSSP